MNVLKKKKPKNIGCELIDIKNVYEYDNLGENYSILKDFISSESAEDQLKILKNIVNQFELTDQKATHFFAVVYLYSPAKHPIKCFLIKYITKSPNHNAFTTALSQEISSKLTLNDYSDFLMLIPKTVLCIENFPAGVASIKLIDKDLAEYLVKCLGCCNQLLKNPLLLPTKKTEIFTLEHSSLRLLVHITQKLNKDDYINWSSIFDTVNCHLEGMVDDEEMPMDTKCLCGILFLLIEALKTEEFETVVKKILSSKDYSILKSRMGELAVYYGLATSVPVKHLTCDVGDKLAMEVLVDRLLEVAERCASSSCISISVTRSLVQVCRSLLSLPTALAAHMSVDLLHDMCTRLDDSQDCVRHLAATGLQAVVEFCVHLDAMGTPSPLSCCVSVISVMAPLSRARVSAARCLVARVGAHTALNRVCTVGDILEALDVPHLQPAARATLDILLERHSRVADADELFTTWVRPALQARGKRSSETLLAAVLMLRPEMLNRITLSMESNKVWVLVAARKAGLPWREHVTFDELYAAAVNSDTMVRIQALSLVVETPKTTEQFTPEDISFLTHYLKYNMNSHDINYRQTVIGLFIKALERASRTGDASLATATRSLCVRDMSQVSATRRATAAALLNSAQNICAEKGKIKWSEEDVEILLKNLEDSYETNQTVALNALQDCPTELLQKEYSTSLNLKDILNQATSLKPADSLAAAYKLLLVLTKLPQRIVDDALDMPASSKEAFILCSKLNNATKSQMSAAFAPLHCLSAVIHTVDQTTLTSEPEWLHLIEDIMCLCEHVTETAGHVVNNASPEGYLPDGSNDSCSTSINGRPMTAQMVLLCAWRSVKEASLLLGWLGGILGQSGRVDVPSRVGRGLVQLLRGCQHRGAFEQAAAGLAILLKRISSMEELSGLPKQWLEELLNHVSEADENELQTTRRSAGLPFLIQALLSSQPHLASQTASTLLHIATGLGTALRRTTAINILCALIKHSCLESVMSPFVERGLSVALTGIDADGWPERTASCLLFSALCVRIFGVVRSKDKLDVRNTLPARLFFIRYPNIYDVMLNKLQAALQSDSELLRPCVYPVLLILGRLRPSVEGTVATLKVSAFEPLILRCSSSAVLKTRQLAAAAAVALLTPNRYLPDIIQTFSTISSQNITTNHCHGLLLRLIKILDEIPYKDYTDEKKNNIDNKTEEQINTRNNSYTEKNNTEENSIAREENKHKENDKVNTDKRNNEFKDTNVKEHSNIEGNSNVKDRDKIINSEMNCDVVRNSDMKNSNVEEIINVQGSTWLLNQPCFVLIQEYVKVIQMMLTRYPEHLPQKLRLSISNKLEHIIFSDKQTKSPGRGAGLAACMNLYMQLNCNLEVLLKGLSHDCYELVLATLNYILELNTGNPIVTQLQKHTEYNNILRSGYYQGRYLECRRKCLQLLTSQRDTQIYVINDLEATNKQIVPILLEKFKTSHILEKHMFLKSLLNFITKESTVLKLQVMEVAYSNCLDENADDVRDVVLDYLEENAGNILSMDHDLEDCERFEYRATLYALLVVLLEDDDENTRQRASDVTIKIIKSHTCDTTLSKSETTLCYTDPSDKTLSYNETFLTTLSDTESILPSYCGELFRNYLKTLQIKLEEKLAYLIIIALLEFKGESCGTDLVNDEFRVFDQSDRSNLYLEDALWTDACANIIIDCKQNNLIHLILDIINNETYSRTFQTLCRNNLDVFIRLANGEMLDKKVNLKVERFIQQLRLHCL